MSTFINKLQEREKRMEASRLKTKELLTSNPAIKQYLDQFNARSVQSFIAGYAIIISEMEEYGMMYENRDEEYGMQHTDRAWECLQEIQLKKLLDVRYEWGAGLVQIPGIDFSYDFYPWADDVLNCSFITAITVEEVNLYMRYLASDDFEYDTEMNWVQLERVRHIEDNPDLEYLYEGWFRYHDTFAGGVRKFFLPDYLGQKEDYYARIARNEKVEELEKKYESVELVKPVADGRPYINSFDKQHVQDFMKCFEKPGTIRLFEVYEKYGRQLKSDEEEFLDEEVNGIIEILSEMRDLRLPVEANEDWRKALINAWNKFTNHQLKKHLPNVYEDYIFRLQQGIQFRKQDKSRLKEIGDIMRKEVIRGMELNGEVLDGDA